MITVANKYIEKFVQNQLFGNSYQNIHAMTGNPINVNTFYRIYYFHLYLEIWHDSSLFVTHGNVSPLTKY